MSSRDHLAWRWIYKKIAVKNSRNSEIKRSIDFPDARALPLSGQEMMSEVGVIFIRHSTSRPFNSHKQTSRDGERKKMTWWKVWFVNVGCFKTRRVVENRNCSRFNVVFRAIFVPGKGTAWFYENCYALITRDSDMFHLRSIRLWLAGERHCCRPGSTNLRLRPCLRDDEEGEAEME